MHLSRRIGTYVELRLDALKSAASQTRVTGPAETQPSRWHSQSQATPASRPLQLLADAKADLCRNITQAEVSKATFCSMIEKQKVKDTEDTMKDLMFIYGEAMAGGPSVASRGEGDAWA